MSLHMMNFSNSEIESDHKSNDINGQVLPLAQYRSDHQSKQENEERELEEKDQRSTRQKLEFEHTLRER